MANEVSAHVLEDDGRIPNSKLPLLVYRAAVPLSGDDPAKVFEKQFKNNGWEGTWRDGIYSYHHYHSTAHEVLGVYAGEAKLQFGGEPGVVETVRVGDVVIIPAGVGHKNLGATHDFGVVGAYPKGQDYDMCYGKPEERPRAIKNIERVAKPEGDPVFGKSGPLVKHWT
ncbi:MAG: cupin domain-containing protein [Verrucomicrobia subdivision 3 bacterium]|nr:cupin domain-containing protein [Limisphaerales bacterium]